MGDKCEYIGPYITAEQNWELDEVLQLDEIGKKLKTLSVFAYESEPIFVPVFGLGGHTQVDEEKIGCTKVIDMICRDPSAEVSLFRKTHAEDIKQIEKYYGNPLIGWGFIHQPG